MIRKTINLIRSDLGKSTLALFGGVICFCFPQVPGYLAGSVCLYYCIHRFRPVGAEIINDLRGDLEEANDSGQSASRPEGAPTGDNVSEEVP